jgi:hypothetical protein
MCHAYQLALLVAFFHLTVDQAWFHPPPAHVASSPTHLKPLSKMSCQRVEVEIEPITGEDRQTAWSQELSQGVDEQVRRMLGAGTQREHRKKLGARIDSQPQPEHLSRAAQSSSNFVQLQVRDVQVAEGVPLCQALKTHLQRHGE